jgi:hypothetical protein
MSQISEERMTLVDEEEPEPVLQSGCLLASTIEHYLFYVPDHFQYIMLTSKNPVHLTHAIDRSN